MPVSKYRVRSTCPSCGRRITARAVAAVTTIKEDDHQAKAYLVHEGCQSTMLRKFPLDDDANTENATRRGPCGNLMLQPPTA